MDLQVSFTKLYIKRGGGAHINHSLSPTQFPMLKTINNCLFKTKLLIIGIIVLFWHLKTIYKVFKVYLQYTAKLILKLSEYLRPKLKFKGKLIFLSS